MFRLLITSLCMTLLFTCAQMAAGQDPVRERIQSLQREAAELEKLGRLDAVEKVRQQIKELSAHLSKEGETPADHQLKELHARMDKLLSAAADAHVQGRKDQLEELHQNIQQTFKELLEVEIHRRVAERSGKQEHQHDHAAHEHEHAAAKEHLAAQQKELQARLEDLTAAIVKQQQAGNKEEVGQLHRQAAEVKQHLAELLRRAKLEETAQVAQKNADSQRREAELANQKLIEQLEQQRLRQGLPGGGEIRELGQAVGQLREAIEQLRNEMNQMRERLEAVENK